MYGSILIMVGLFLPEGTGRTVPLYAKLHIACLKKKSPFKTDYEAADQRM